MKIRLIAFVTLLLCGWSVAPAQWEKVEPADFHGTWEIILDAVDWKRALAAIPEKWQQEAKADVTKEMTTTKPTIRITEDRVFFKRAGRREESGEAAWKQLDATTVQLWVKGQSSPIKLRKESDQTYMTRRGLELPLGRKGALRPAAQRGSKMPKRLPDLYAPIAKKARAGDLEAAARLIHLGRWNDVGSIDPRSVKAWSESKDTVSGMSAGQVFACVLANHAVRHRTEYGSRLTKAMQEARRLLDSSPTNHPMLALDLAWLLKDYEPKDAKRAAMLKSWGMKRLASPPDKLDPTARANWMITAAQAHERERSWNDAHPAYEKAAKFFSEAGDIKGEFVALRGHARNLGKQPGVKEPNKRDARAANLFKALSNRQSGANDFEGMGWTCLEMAELVGQKKFRKSYREKGKNAFLNLLKAARMSFGKAGNERMQRAAIARLGAAYGLLAKDDAEQAKRRSGRSARVLLEHAAENAESAAATYRELLGMLKKGTGDYEQIEKLTNSWQRYAANAKRAATNVGTRPAVSKRRAPTKRGGGSSGSFRVPKWGTDYEKALRDAQAKGKIIVADFTGSDWCGWCVKLKKEVFKTPRFKLWAARNAVLLEIDYPKRKWQSAKTKKQNKELDAKYGIEGYPTILLLDENGRELGRLGYVKGGPKAWISKAEQILEAK